jgi:cytosine/adenosine deaminase-related metal-dependent hydrolase
MRADLAVWDVSGLDSAGSWDAAALLLAGPRQVRELYVEGRAVVREGRLATVDAGRIAADARASVRYLAGA